MVGEEGGDGGSSLAFLSRKYDSERSVRCSLVLVGEDVRSALVILLLEG
jgi:hypothetical protein